MRGVSLGIKLTLAVAAPSWPAPIRPRVRPNKPSGMWVCQRELPFTIFLCSRATYLAVDSIKAHMCSNVEVPFPNVPDTMTPFFLAYSTSIPRLRVPVVAMNFKLGSLSIKDAVNFVRSLMAHIIEYGCRRSANLFSSLKVSSNTSHLIRSEIGDQSALENATC